MARVRRSERKTGAAKSSGSSSESTSSSSETAHATPKTKVTVTKSEEKITTTSRSESKSFGRRDPYSSPARSSDNNKDRLNLIEQSLTPGMSFDNIEGQERNYKRNSLSGARWESRGLASRITERRTTPIGPSGFTVTETSSVSRRTVRQPEHDEKLENYDERLREQTETNSGTPSNQTSARSHGNYKYERKEGVENKGMVSYANSLYHWISGYIFWCLFLGIGPMIWFYPMNELDITGYEAFVLCILLPPLFLDIGFVRRIFMSRPGQFLLDAIVLVGILSFRAPTTLQRLVVLSVGAGGAVLKLGTDLMLENPLVRRKRSFWGYTLGFLVFLASRVAYKTFVPTWNDYLSNAVVAGVAAANLILGLITGASKKLKNPYLTYEEIIAKREVRSILVGPGLGSLLYLTHSVLGELSVPSRWVVQPHPNPAPEGLPFGIAIMSMMIYGISHSRCPGIVYHPLVSLALFPAFYAIYKLSGIIGFVLGGCALAYAWGLLLPAFLNLAGKTGDKIGRTIFLAILTYLVEIFYAVWTVAYNFVPGGVYTREFTGLTLGVMGVTMGAALQAHRKKPSARDNSINPAFTMKNGCSTVWPWFRIRKDIGIIFLLTTIAMGSRYISYQPGSTVKPQTGNPQVSAMIWTYHFGYDNYGWPSLERSANLMKELDVDVIGLLETDASKAFMGSNDLTAWLGEELQMYTDFGPGTRDHTWGNILLSRYPILESQHLLLPSPHGELAPALTAVLNVTNQKLGIVLTHMGNDRDDLDRKLQAEVLSEHSAKLQKRGIPVIFLGYVTSRPGSRDYQTFKDKGNLRDIDATDKDRFCEYILYGGKNIQRKAYARVSKGELTDTEIQVAKFELLAENEKEMETEIVKDGKGIPASLRFPPSLGSYRDFHYAGPDHRYHMSTPKYFVSPSKKEGSV